MQNVLNLTGKSFQVLSAIIISLSVLACSDVQKREKPENLIPKEKMVEIYTDMIILDALDRTSPRTLQSFEVKISDHITRKFGTDSSTLAQNIEYYNFEFETNADIYNEVLKNIEAKKREIDSIVEIRDSLRKEEIKLKNDKKTDSVQPFKKMSPQKMINND
jgi:hypothetical protein